MPILLEFHPNAYRAGITQTIMTKLLQVFAKAPKFGEVKTRVAQQLGDHSALKLHHILCEAAVELAKQCSADAIEIWTTSEQGRKYFDKTGLPVKMQQGDQLGQRMLYAIEQGLLKHSSVVLIGADAFSLTRDDIGDAFQILASNDMVFAPAIDGGYVLVGATRVHSVVFEGISWGTCEVMSQTLCRLNHAKVKYGLLDVRWDIDTLDDLERYAPQLLERIH